LQIIRARITCYRSAQDSGEFSAEPDLTCLVGENYSGKTALLQALYRLNPAEPLADFDEVADFPAVAGKAALAGPRTPDDSRGQRHAPLQRP